MKTIIEQLTEYCDCLPDIDDEQLTRNINEMVYLISNVTCWAQEPCETFLNSERTEVIDLEDFDFCGELIQKHRPFYNEVKPETIKVVLIEEAGVSDIKTPLSNEEYGYSEISNEIRIDVSKYVENSHCEPKIRRRLMIGYNAGYELLPECLLPLFCDALHVIYNKNDKCSCTACQSCPNPDELDEDVDIFEMYVIQLMQKAYAKQLSLISLCRNEPCIWSSLV